MSITQEANDAVGDHFTDASAETTLFVLIVSLLLYLSLSLSSMITFVLSIIILIADLHQTLIVIVVL